MSRGQTIQIFLPSGNPQGLRQAEITTRTVQVFDIPRASLGDFLAMDQSRQVGLYFLFSEASESDERAECYIGESDDVHQRLRSHERGKDFWNRALVAVSLTNSWTKAHVRYLENKAVLAAKENGRYGLVNGNEGFAAAYTPRPLQADCDEFFDTIAVLTATLGFPILRALPSKRDTAPARLLHIRGMEGITSGSFSDEGLTVFAGTQIDPGSSARRAYPQIEARRAALLKDGVLRQEPDGTTRFVHDHLFPTPSGAACVILGRNANGWENWRDASGHRLDEIERRVTIGQGDGHVDG